ncbi:DUF6295 family protein [Siccirubricoccus deserti]
MCTSIIEIVAAEGMAKRGEGWFPLTQAVVAYDHARHAPLADVITLDFFNAGLEPGARAGVELTLDSAKGLRAALDRAIAAADSKRRKCGARCEPAPGPRRVEAAASNLGRGQRAIGANFKEVP